jgi:hypothetical protein
MTKPAEQINYKIPAAVTIQKTTCFPGSCLKKVLSRHDLIMPQNLFHILTGTQIQQKSAYDAFGTVSKPSSNKKLSLLQCKE